jgi:hypothetical protein
MKQKFLTPGEFPKKFKAKSELTFSEDSPFTRITLPPEKTLFYAWHWDHPLIMADSRGTAYICRKGHHPYKFDFDVSSLRSKNSKCVPEFFRVYMDYHNTKEIPPFLMAGMPEDIKNKVQLYLDGSGSNH